MGQPVAVQVGSRFLVIWFCPRKNARKQVPAVGQKLGKSTAGKAPSVPRAQPPSPATKATALAALTTGESVSSVARRRGISRTTAARWRDEAGLNETTGVVHEKSGHG